MSDLSLTKSMVLLGMRMTASAYGGTVVTSKTPVGKGKRRGVKRQRVKQTKSSLVSVARNDEMGAAELRAVMNRTRNVIKADNPSRIIGDSGLHEASAVTEKESALLLFEENVSD